MLHQRLLDLESELLAKEEAERGLDELTFECANLLDTIEHEIGLRLADKCPDAWRGWLSYRRGKEALIILRGRAFSIGGMFPVARAGFDTISGAEAINEHQRGFDPSVPSDLDYLLLNFGKGEKVRVFLWYAENIAPYRLIFEGDVAENPEKELHDAIVEALSWITKRPKHTTLPEFLSTLNEETKG